MSNDIEAGGPAAANESTPLVGDSPSNDELNASISSGSVTSTDDIKDKEELEKPWPATFERGIQILASPIIDVKKVADYTKSPSVRARYRKVSSLIAEHTRCEISSFFPRHLNKLYFVPSTLPAASSQPRL